MQQIASGRYSLHCIPFGDYSVYTPCMLKALRGLAQALISCCFCVDLNALIEADQLGFNLVFDVDVSVQQRLHAHQRLLCCVLLEGHCSCQED